MTRAPAAAKPAVSPPRHPGEVIALRLAAQGFTRAEAARELGLSRKRLSALPDGSAPITEHLAWLLADVLGDSPEWWLALQTAADEPPSSPPGAYTPGLVIAQHLESAGFTLAEAAVEIGVSRKRLTALLNGSAPITPSVADGLAYAFGGEAETWLNLQAAHDQAVAPPPPPAAPAPVFRRAPWAFFAAFLVAAVAFYFAGDLILIGVAIWLGVVGWVKLARRFPMTAWFVLGCFRGLSSRPRRRF